MTTAWLPQGTVYGTLMNFANEHAALAAQMTAAPYKAAPLAPVLYIKPANTFSAHGSSIVLPPKVQQVQVRATVGLVFMKNTALDQSTIAGAAIQNIAFMVLLSDLTIPHASFFRPPVKFNCLDGFLCAGQTPTAVSSLAQLDDLTVSVRINSVVAHTFNTAHMVRRAAQLVDDVAGFIDLQDGDVLMIGSPFDVPLACAGDAVEISAPGFAPLCHTLVAQAGERV
jgi:5-oxopent-3-ene-1,2,5-tricarboxylate decarboxylase / 2-hydroxyhepta-2,4-diene-1,7-dioate isomerase